MTTKDDNRVDFDKLWQKISKGVGQLSEKDKGQGAVKTVYRNGMKMKRLEELAKATNEYHNCLMSITEKAGEKIISSIDITTYSTTVCKPSIFVDDAFTEIIKNSDQMKKEDFDNGYTMYWVTVEGVKFCFLEGEES